MLAYILALAVGAGSLAIYLAAFFLPEIHRKSDFYWSGVGLFYALVLWVCAGRITGGVLLGQIAGVALLGWFGWQTLTLRRELTPKSQQTELPNPEKVVTQAKSIKASLPAGISQLPQKLTALFNNFKGQKPSPKSKAKSTPAKPPQTVTPGATTVTTITPATPVDPGVEAVQSETTGETPTEKSPELDISLNQKVVDLPTTEDSLKPSETPELLHPNPLKPKLVEEVVEDAAEKILPASPPETGKPDSPFDKIEKG